MSQLNPPLPHGYAESAAARDKKRAKSVRWLIMPSTAVLFLWMAIPLAMTIWYSFSRYNLLNPDIKGFAGIDNYKYLATDPAFGPSIVHTLVLIGSSETRFILLSAANFMTILPISVEPVKATLSTSI